MFFENIATSSLDLVYKTCRKSLASSFSSFCSFHILVDPNLSLNRRGRLLEASLPALKMQTLLEPVPPAKLIGASETQILWNFGTC